MMESMIKVLAAARREEKRRREAVQAAQEAVAATSVGKRLAVCVVAVQHAKQRAAWLEAGVREEALAVFEGLGDANPHPAVKVKSYIVYEYDPAAVLEYARLHLPSTVKLDTRKFEKACGGIEVPGVATRIEPRATIKRDLSQWEDPDG